MEYSALDKIIYKYRMLGFDKPTFMYSKYFNCIIMEIIDCAGQWKTIKGNSEYACMVGAIKWTKANWFTIKKGRDYILSLYKEINNAN